MTAIDTCANCASLIIADKRALYDDRSEKHFCDSQCFHEWAEDKGAEKILAFYRLMNVTEVTY